MKRLLLAAVAAISITGSAAAQDFYLSQILVLGSNFCPYGTLPADGSLLPINQYQALFSLLGITYGGNGTTNFALPNLKPVLTATRAPLTQCIVTAGIFPSRN